MQKPVRQIYSFDEFTLDLTRGCLRRGAEEIKLRPKSFEVLKYLAENGGRLISKDEIIEVVWQGMAVTDDSLVQCLKDIRRALDDKSQAIIKTVPRRGYIFENEVSENGAATIYAEETTGVHLVIEETEDFGHGDAATQKHSRIIAAPHKQTKTASLTGAIKQNKRAAFFVLASFVVVITTVAAWRFYENQSAKKTPRMSAALFQNVELKSLTRVGNIVNTAVSPDGKNAVYTTGDAGRETLWLRQIATDSAQQIIAPAEARYYGVIFSPDGEYIYYLRAEKANPFPRILYRIPKLGGVSEKVSADMDWCPSFSPDGKRITFVRDSESRDESVLMTANADGTGEQKIAVRPYSEAYTYPVWSPDGQTIAASAGSAELGDSFREVVAVNVSDGTEKTITTRKWYWIAYIAWLSDGSGLIMSANPQKSMAHSPLWMLSYPNGEVRQITNDSYNYDYVSLSADSRALLAHHVELLTHLWIAPDSDASRARNITSGLGNFKHIRWTPDGKLIIAAHGGSTIDIWQRDADGGNAKQLTANAGTNWGNDVSPDGRYIVFDSDRAGNFHIWRMDADGGNAIQLTNGSGEKFPDISPDGRWIVYTAFMDWTLWKIPVEGGSPVQLTEKYAREASVSPDGKWIVYTTRDNNRLALISFEGGAPVKFFDLPPGANAPQWVRFSPDGQSIVFIVRRENIDNLWSMPIDGGSPKQITNFTSDGIFGYDWSDDGKNLAIIRGAWTADMVLLLQK